MKLRYSWKRWLPLFGVFVLLAAGTIASCGKSGGGDSGGSNSGSGSKTPSGSGTVVITGRIN
jgi:hypothetical protein